MDDGQATDEVLAAGEEPSVEEMIRVRGASTHNLQEVDLDLPRNQLITFCGASGSGKTSMAIETLYAEGQRRYIESFSPYTRQFLEQLDKPDCDAIEGLPPAVAVTRTSGSRSNRSTVATATEIADHLRLLYARAGEIFCDECQTPVRQDHVDGIVELLSTTSPGSKAMIGFVASPELSATELVELGYLRTVSEGSIKDLQSLAPDGPVDEPLAIVLDRIVLGKTDEARLADSVESALRGGDGACRVWIEDADGQADDPEVIDGRRWRRLGFDTRLRCNGCGREFSTPEPQLFNFNSPLGACEQCEGFGSIVELDMDLVVPDKSKSLSEGAIAPWTTPAYAHEIEELLALAPDYQIRVDVPFSELNAQEIRYLIEGVPERDFGGLNGFVRWLERRKYKMHLRVFLSRWRSYSPCPSCHGSRLNADALAVRLGGKNFSELCRMELREAREWLAELSLPEPQAKILESVLGEVLSRIDFLRDVGLGYLELDRTLRTLSTGELQRVGMTSTLGSTLVDMLYVLDEPSVGLHASDIEGLSRSLTNLRDRGNTVVVVEHEEEILRASDRLVEFGPQAGSEGGRVVFAGAADQITDCRESRTGDWLAGRRVVHSNAETRRDASEGRLSVLGARGANLGDGENGLDVSFPLGVLCVVTGVSGAGKSSLVRRTLYPALAEKLHDRNGKSGEAKNHEDRPLPYEELVGLRQIDDVVLIDQSPIARSPRSNPVTYLKAFDPIREVFAEQPDAQARGLKASHFSFNVDGGRCETCQGTGQVEIDMQFLADIYMRCRECDGRRYRDEVLEVKYRGRDIAEALELTVLEAFRFFRGHPKVQSKLQLLIDVGLEYLQLGQPANTLSSGEGQRLKLAGRLSVKNAARTLFIMDEPTTGLHFSDVEHLIDCFTALTDVGHSLVIIEHNVPMMMAADWIIDLGPGAAGDGGRVVVEGTPETVAACPGSATGRVLSEAFARRDAALEALEAEEALLADE